MNLQLYLLRQTTSLTIYYDLSNDWLFLDWQGELTLPAVQQACLAVMDCYLPRPYSHILNSNEQVTSVNWSVATWLATDFLPHMRLAGIEYMAWVHSSALPGLNMLHTILNWLPSSPITAFRDLEEAAQWLQQTRAGQPCSYAVPRRLPAIQAQVAQQMQAIRERVAAKQHKPHSVGRAAA